MKRHFLIVLFFSFCFWAKGQEFAVQPGTMSFNVEPGKTQSQVVKISNTSPKKVAFQAYLADWLRDSTGAHAYFRPDTLARSCANWITLNKNFVEVQPGQSEEIVVTINGANDPSLFHDMRWAMLFLQTVEEQNGAPSQKPKELKTQVKEIVRVGVHIYQSPLSLTKTSAQALFLRPAKEKNTYEFGVNNTGETMIQCKAYLTLTNALTGEEIKLERIEFPMFPDQKRIVKFIIPEKTAKASYSALAVLDIGEDKELQAIEKTIEIK